MAAAGCRSSSRPFTGKRTARAHGLIQPAVNVDPLKFLSSENSKQQPEAEETAQKENGNSVFKGLNVMMLVGMVLTVLGCLLKQFHFSRRRGEK